MSPKRTRKANELPYIPLGPFQWRIPGIHYKLEYVEFFQGLILGATALSLAVVQLFNPGPKGRNTGIYYTFMGAASYLIPVVAAQLTKSSGEASAVYSLMIMLLVFAILAILSSLYLVAQHKKIFGKSAL